MSVEGLRVIDGFNLPEDYRALLRPGETETDFTAMFIICPDSFTKSAAGRKRTKFGWHGTSGSRN